MSDDTCKLSLRHLSMSLSQSEILSSCSVVWVWYPFGTSQMRDSSVRSFSDFCSQWHVHCKILSCIG